MASDEIVWQIINQQFCSYKLNSARTTRDKGFCRNEYNVTGLCNRQSCPLANSRYATVRSHPTKNTLYLYIKTIERAHQPKYLWEKVKLSGNYQKALQQIDERLMFFPKFQIHKAKQRITKLTQVAIRMRKIAAEEERLGEKVVPKMSGKIRHREATRERKAEAAAKLERTVERELLERLRSGAYGDQPLNVSEAVWKKVLKGLEKSGEAERDRDMVSEDEDEDEEEREKNGQQLEDEEEQDDEMDGQVEYVSDFDESDEELADIEDWLGSGEDGENDDDDDADEDDEEASGDESGKKPATKGKFGDKRKRGRVTRMQPKKRREVEAENEDERQRVLAF